MTSSGLTPEAARALTDEEALARAVFCDCERGRALWALAQRRVDGWRAFEAQTEQARRAVLARRDADVFAQSGVPRRYRELSLKGFVAAARGDAGKQAAVDAVRAFERDGYATSMAGVRKRSLLIYGERGVGKTGVLAPLFFRLESAGHDCLWLPFLTLMSQIRAGYDTGDAYARLERAKRADVLLIDDLGQSDRSAESTHTRAIMQEIIYHRHGDDLITFFTTNQAPEKLKSQFSVEFYQRVAEMAVIVEMGGRVLRSLG